MKQRSGHIVAGSLPTKVYAALVGARVATMASTFRPATKSSDLTSRRRRMQRQRRFSPASTNNARSHASFPVTIVLSGISYYGHA
jgi:hypothetical protein